MSDTAPHDILIRALAAQLRPVKPLRPPLVRAAAWLGLVLLGALGLALFANTHAMMQRLMSAPDLWIAALASLTTAILAAVAVFELGLPDRSPRWALLPLPAALIWIGASGLGCLRTWVAPATRPAPTDYGLDCLTFILLVSLPLSVALILMLRRAYSLRPKLAAAVGGLAIAAAAATLLNFFHPFDAAAVDLSAHAVAVGLVVLANSIWGGRLIGG